MRGRGRGGLRRRVGLGRGWMQWLKSRLEMGYRLDIGVVFIFVFGDRERNWKRDLETTGLRYGQGKRKPKGGLGGLFLLLKP